MDVSVAPSDAATQVTTFKRQRTDYHEGRRTMSVCYVEWICNAMDKCTKHGPAALAGLEGGSYSRSCPACVLLVLAKDVPRVIPRRFIPLTRELSAESGLCQCVAFSEIFSDDDESECEPPIDEPGK